MSRSTILYPLVGISTAFLQASCEEPQRFTLESLPAMVYAIDVDAHLERIVSSEKEQQRTAEEQKEKGDLLELERKLLLKADRDCSGTVTIREFLSFYRIAMTKDFPASYPSKVERNNPYFKDYVTFTIENKSAGANPPRVVHSSEKCVCVGADRECFAFYKQRYDRRYDRGLHLQKVILDQMYAAVEDHNSILSENNASLERLHNWVLADPDISPGGVVLQMENLKDREREKEREVRSLRSDYNRSLRALSNDLEFIKNESKLFCLNRCLEVKYFYTSWDVFLSQQLTKDLLGKSNDSACQVERNKNQRK